MNLNFSPFGSELGCDDKRAKLRVVAFEFFMLFVAKLGLAFAFLMLLVAKLGVAYAFLMLLVAKLGVAYAFLMLLVAKLGGFCVSPIVGCQISDAFAFL